MLVIRRDSLLEIVAFLMADVLQMGEVLLGRGHQRVGRNKRSALRHFALSGRAVPC
jgi:hypothetical protein